MERTRKRDGLTEGRTVRLLYASQSSFGGIKIKQKWGHQTNYLAGRIRILIQGK